MKYTPKHIYVSGVRANAARLKKIFKSGQKLKLTNPYIVRVGEIVWRVPAGFETDLASVPRTFWKILPPWGEYFPAAVVHDFLYSAYGPDADPAARKKADLAFLLIMEAIGVPWWKQKLMYRAVRLFGKAAWNHK